MLWVDKYRPRTLDKVMVHTEEAQRLKNLVRCTRMLSMMLYGTLT
jgi:replication factor C subunit 3/5